MPLHIDDTLKWALIQEGMSEEEFEELVKNYYTESPGNDERDMSSTILSSTMVNEEMHSMLINGLLNKVAQLEKDIRELKNK